MTISAILDIFVSNIVQGYATVAITLRVYLWPEKPSWKNQPHEATNEVGKEIHLKEKPLGLSEQFRSFQRAFQLIVIQDQKIQTA